MRWNAMAMVVQANRQSLASTAATSRATHRPPRCTRSASITSGARASDAAPRRHGVHPGPLLARHLCARLPRRPPDRGAAQALPPGSGRRRPVVLSASVADAGLLAVPDGLDGPRPDDGDLPGALHRATSSTAASCRPPTARCGLLGDGEMDEPESIGALTMPVRERLDNLVFVINCNLQRLDGPVRGNGKIIQELEAAFLGAGWNVIKVRVGLALGSAAAQDTKGLLRRLMEECVDGEYQNFKAKGGAYTREHFFGKYPELKEMVANMSDEEIWHLNRGGHDARKVFAAYRGGVEAQGPAHRHPRARRSRASASARPAEGADHHAPAEEARRRVAARVPRPLQHSGLRRRHRQAAVLPQPAEDSEEIKYLQARRGRSAATCPARSDRAPPLEIPRARGVRSRCSTARGEREISTTMAFVRILGIAAEGQGHRPARRADRAGRGAHLRHGRPVPADRHLFVDGPAVHAAGCRPAAVLPRGQEGPDPRGRHQRSRRDVHLDRGGHGLRESRRQHGAVLHLLLDVRFPAHR